MKKLLLAIALLCLPVSVGAQAGDKDDTQGRTEILSPAANTTVGRTFEITGRTVPNCVVNVYIDNFSDQNLIFYLNPADRPAFRSNYGSGIPANATADAQGNYTIKMDLNGPEAILPKNGILSPLSAGTHIFQVRPGFCSGADQNYPQVRLTVKDQVGGGTVASPVGTATPISTPAATSSPASLFSPEEGAGIDPLFALILGTLLGAAVLSVAEVSALEYQRKHGRKGGKLTKK